MPSRSTSSATSARQRLAAARAQEQRKRRQRTQLIVLAAALVLVLVVVAVALVLSQRGGDDGTPATTSPQVVDGDFLGVITSLPASTYEAAGVPAQPVGNTFALPDGAPVLTDGLPTVTYVGAEYCPYCAGERWALVAALSRFGEFSGLEASYSADNEGDIPTITFVDSTYTSDVVALAPYETADREGNPLQTLPDDVSKALQTYDGPPYAEQTGSIPWTYLGTYQSIGSSVPIQGFFPDAPASSSGWPTSTLTHADVASAMAAGSDGLGKDILAASNVMTAQICTLTDNAPEDVCTAPEVVAASAQLPA